MGPLFGNLFKTLASALKTGERLNVRQSGSDFADLSPTEMLLSKAMPAAQRELAELTTFAKGHGFEEDELALWDVTYWSERQSEEGRGGGVVGGKALWVWGVRIALGEGAPARHVNPRATSSQSAASKQ